MHFSCRVDTVNFFCEGPKATLDFHSSELKLQNSVWLCRWKKKKRKMWSPDHNETLCYRNKVLAFCSAL